MVGRPTPRGVIPLDDLRVTRSLRRSLRRYRITVDIAFADVVDACRAIERPHGWISPDIRDAYVGLHRMGWAHSVEAWSEEGELVGRVVRGVDRRAVRGRVDVSC